MTPELSRARSASYSIFVLNGLVFASWLARLPAIKDDLGLRTAQMGLLLLCTSVGSVGALLAGGAVVGRFGPRRTVLVSACLSSGALALLGVASGLGSPVLAGFSLFLFGAGVSPWDIAMNIEGAGVERRLGRDLLPRLHGGFSVGTIIGAGLGALTASQSVSVTAQLLVSALLIPPAVAVAVRSFLAAPPQQEAAAAGRVRDAWRDRRTLLIGLFVLAFALTEGVANDWLALALVEGHGTSETLGAIGFGVFVTGMTASRFLGGALLTRYGRVPTLRAATGVSLVGLLLVVFGGPLALVMVGAALWGVGAALGFPVGMSAAAEDPAKAAARVSVVSAIGYTAFLGGPPLVGFLVGASGVLRALLLVVVALALGGLLAGSTREAPPARQLA